VHIAVVDPGVGTERKSVMVQVKNTYFVGPDNGLLIPAAKSLGKFSVYEITKNLPDVSYTFHGRDIFFRRALNCVVESEDAGLLVLDLDRVKLRQGEGVALDHACVDGARAWDNLYYV